MPQSQYTPGAYFQISNLTRDVPNLYLTAPGTSPGAVTFQKPSSKDGVPDASQLWYVMPLDNDRHLIVNRGSGLALGSKNGSKDLYTAVEQQPAKADLIGGGQTWYMRMEADHLSRAELVNADSNLVLSPDTRSGYGYYPGKSPVLEAKYPAGVYHSQMFALECYSGYGAVAPHLRRRPGDADDIGDVIRLKGFAPPAGDRTDQVLVGSVLIPFPFINDPVLSRARQGQENPYYVLKRYGSWRNVYYYEHSGASAYTKEEEVTVGVTTSNTKEVEHTAGVKLTATSEFSFMGASTTLSVEAQYQLKVSTTTTSTSENTRKTTIRREYPAGPRRAEAIWYREDRFVLERLNGEHVLEWAVRNPDRVITDAYPAR
ncbi:hypothetical protein [Streptomyces sp. NPDC127112]|uniref:hypothetical protein n=1 Tax=Streptomyces sp. NPDC127112 TaxID=3345364 RepID=UPI0036297BDC